MKRFVYQSALIILLCSLLTGCDIGFFPYYDTPMKAYQQDPVTFQVENEVYDDIDAEIDCIALSDSEAIWFAVVNGEEMVETLMEVKDGKYRMGNTASISYISGFKDQSDAEMLKNLGYNSFPLSDDRSIYYTFVLTEALPENDEERDYTVKNYTVPVNGEDTDLTLVYYFEEMG